MTSSLIATKERFTRPRRGEAPDAGEVRRFWNYLHERDRLSIGVVSEDEQVMPDLPAMSVKDILRLIWDKVFNIRIETVCAVIFAVVFEVMRRWFKLSFLFAVVPAVIMFVCVLLIHKRKGSPDLLSDLGAGALLFILLWVSGVATYPSKESPKVEQMLTLKPRLSGDELSFMIVASDISDVREFLYRISPDKEYHSTGFIKQEDTEVARQSPKNLIDSSRNDGSIDLSVKYIDRNGTESKTWTFSFDVVQEALRVSKEAILNEQVVWLEIEKVSYYELGEETYLEVNPLLISDYGRRIIKSLVYGVDTLSPDVTVSFAELLEAGQEAFCLRRVANDAKMVSSYLMFNDGTSSDIRRSMLMD